MDLNWFMEFVVLSETLNYSDAADKLYTTQSTLSKHIMAMERELGIPLFKRSYHRLELTDFGRAILPHAYDMLSVKGHYEAEASAFMKKNSKVLRIEAIPALPDYGITEKFLSFQEQHPDVQIAVSEADSNIIRKELMEHKCDLAILRSAKGIMDAASVLSDEDMLCKIPISRDRMVAVLPLTHPLAGEHRITLQQLAKDRFVLIKEGSLPYQMCISACRDAGFIPRVEFTSHNRDAMVDMVVKGCRTALLFSSHIESLRGRGAEFAAIPIRPGIYTEVYIAYLRHGTLSDHARDFLSMFEQETEQHDSI